MSLTPSEIRDNPQQPGVQAQVYIPDQLIADARNLVTQPILLGAGVLKRVLAEIILIIQSQQTIRFVFSMMT